MTFLDDADADELRARLLAGFLRVLATAVAPRDVSFRLVKIQRNEGGVKLADSRGEAELRSFYKWSGEWES